MKKFLKLLEIETKRCKLSEKQLNACIIAFNSRKIGKMVKIIGNSNSHGFSIGEVVKLVVYTSHDEFKAENSKDYWYLKREDFKILRKTK